MSRIRFLRMRIPYAEFSTTVSPAIERSVEERKAPSTMVLDFFPEDSITVGCLEDPLKCLDLDFCREAGILVRRRRNTGGAILGGRGSAFLVLCLDTREGWVPMKNLEEGFTRSLTAMAEAMVSTWGLEARWRPLNDVEVHGRKIVASSARLEEDILTLRLVVNVCPVDCGMLSRAMRIPPEKMKDKAVKNPAQRVSSLEQELGRKLEEQELLRLVRTAVARMLGEDVELVEEGLSAVEERFAREARRLMCSEQWFWGRSEAWRQRGVPSGATRLEGIHKAPAGLVRETLWVKDKTVLEALVTGDFHAKPLDVVEKLEASLKGGEAQMESLAPRVRGVLLTPGVELPGMDLDDILEALRRALQGTPGPAESVGDG
ncbi:MAG: lipoate--protein ligase family protein [Thermodesulfobacteriota bacterium]